MKAHQRHLSLCLFLVAAAPLIDTAHGFVVVPSEHKSFASLPAQFGEQWEDSVMVPARLQFLEERPRMCRKDRGRNITVVVPKDGLPVALLVERGGCSFIEKAKEALRLSDAVKYVVISDNEDETMLRMSGTHFAGAAPLMISKKSGTELKQIFMQNSNENPSEGGLVVELHGLSLNRVEYSSKSKFFFRFILPYIFFLSAMVLVLCAWKKKKGDEEIPPFIHAGHVCDGCSCRPIVGKRYRATNAEDFDLCKECHSSYSGDLQLEETELLPRDTQHQHAWRIYRILTGIDPPPTNMTKTKDAKDGDDDDTVESTDEEGLSLVNELV